MEDQRGALGLVLNAVVLWNSTYLNAAVDQLRAQNYPVADADAARLSPLIDAHLNVHGTYTFFLPQLDGLRPLRDLTGFEPITGRVHQPPPVHQVFEGDGFVICNFVPRKVDYHPYAIPVQY